MHVSTSYIMSVNKVMTGMSAKAVALCLPWGRWSGPLSMFKKLHFLFGKESHNFYTKYLNSRFSCIKIKLLKPFSSECQEQNEIVCFQPDFSTPEKYQCFLFQEVGHKLLLENGYRLCNELLNKKRTGPSLNLVFLLFFLQKVSTLERLSELKDVYLNKFLYIGFGISEAHLVHRPQYQHRGSLHSR